MTRSGSGKPLPLFRLGPMDGVDSLSVFHAAAELGIECVIITSPATTFVSSGYFDNARSVLDLNAIAAGNIPVFRRRIGGGVVLLDANQVFYQVVLLRDNPMAPRVVKEAYLKFSRAPIRAFAQIGAPVEYRPINDLVVAESGRKISGQGAGVVGDCFIFVGNILIDFDYQLMADIIRLSDKKRESFVRLLENNVSSLARELERSPPKSDVEDILAKEFMAEFNTLVQTPPPEKLLERARKLSVYMTSEEFVFEESERQHNSIKVREGVYFQRD
ncbi:Lipoate-protein ligase A [hydrothermal vent metagenome]|uniref:Lipoate-protein ligase A n=1 Tax=hydrothermal vent metagenome TaxID=652676 RepID=A0A3B1BFA2_9ZZZZ